MNSLFLIAKVIFQSVIGYRGSLAQTIEQLKWQRFILAVDCLS